MTDPGYKATRDNPPPVGFSVETQRILTQEDLDLFAELSSDDNPIHVDPEFSARTRFGRTVAHGMLLYSLICGLLGDHFPGTIQYQQNFVFPAPTFTGEPMTIRAEVLEVTSGGGGVRLATTITNLEGVIVCDGECLLIWRKA